MKSLVIVALILLGLSAINADRPRSEKVLAEIDKVRPRYRQIQDFVIETISNARYNSSEQLAKFHEDILMIKQTFVVHAIDKEEHLLFQLNNQPSTVDANCRSFITTLADTSLNLAGTGSSTCITETSDNLDKLISDFYGLLQQDEKDYVGIGLLNVFKDENIFYTPESILYKLQQKIEAMEGYPSYLEDDLFKSINNLGSNLETLVTTYYKCIGNAVQLLKSSFDMAQSHMTLTCQAVSVPVPGAPSDTNAVNTVGMPNTEAVRLFRERFGL